MLYKEKYRQLTSKAIDINFAYERRLNLKFVMVAIPCLDVSESEVIHLDRDLAIEIQCGPRYKTKKVPVKSGLNNSGQIYEKTQRYTTYLTGSYYTLPAHYKLLVMG